MRTYIVEDITSDRIKSELKHIHVGDPTNEIVDAIRIAADDCTEKVVNEKRILDCASMHPTLIRRGMKVRPTVMGKQWQIDFLSGDQYLIHVTSNVPKEELSYE